LQIQDQIDRTVTCGKQDPMKRTKKKTLITAHQQPLMHRN